MISVPEHCCVWCWALCLSGQEILHIRQELFTYPCTKLQTNSAKKFVTPSFVNNLTAVGWKQSWLQCNSDGDGELQKIWVDAVSFVASRWWWTRVGAAAGGGRRQRAWPSKEAPPWTCPAGGVSMTCTICCAQVARGWLHCIAGYQRAPTLSGRSSVVSSPLNTSWPGMPFACRGWTSTQQAKKRDKKRTNFLSWSWWWSRWGWRTLGGILYRVFTVHQNNNKNATSKTNETKKRTKQTNKVRVEDSGRYECSSNGRRQWVDLTVVESQTSNDNDGDGDMGCC